MNYLSIYEKLIQSSQDRLSIDGYTEIHHIIPKSFGGTNETDNLVKLTPREHFIAHRLLAKVFPISGMIHAVWLMTCSGKYNVNSRTYAVLREAHALRVSNDKSASSKKGRPGKKQSEQHKKLKVERRKQKNQSWHSDQTKQKIADAIKRSHPVRNKGDSRSQNEIDGHARGVAIRKQNGSYVRTPESIEAFKRAITGKPGKPCSEQRKAELKEIKSQKIQCPHCGKEGQCMVMHRWHFDNCRKNPNILLGQDHND